MTFYQLWRQIRKVVAETNVIQKNLTMAQPPSSSIPSTVGGRLDAARTLKLEGNDYFKKQDWRKAISKYHRAKLYCKGITDKLDFLPGLESVSVKTKPTEEQQKEASELILAVSNNLAGMVLYNFLEWKSTLASGK